MNTYFKDEFSLEKINMIKSAISLFKAIPYDEGNSSMLDLDYNQENNIKFGFVFSDNAIKYCYNYITNSEIHKHVLNEYGYNVKTELNRGFYKTFKEPMNSSQYELYIKQILHYITTYGLMSDGIYKDNTIYIPNNEIDKSIDNKVPIKIILIDAIKEDELKEKVKTMITSGIALSEKTLNHLKNIIKYYKFDIDIEQIKNKEMKIIFCDLMDLVPESPIEFLRFLIYLTTYSTLLIKSKAVINITKMRMVTEHEKILNKFKLYLNNVDNGWEKLSSVFLRYKPLILAFKTKENPELNKIINSLSKLSHKYHKPLKEKILDSLSHNSDLSSVSIENELDNITTFKKISIVNGLLYRLNNPDFILYSIRNGKSFVTKYGSREDEFLYNYERYINIIKKSIIKDISPKVKNKKIHLPEDLIYTAPTSEKKFFGNIPFGSYYTFKNKDAVIGVHWFNLLTENNKELSIDLDLRYQSKTKDIGWNTWLNDENYINLKEEEWCFSGDMTSAPIKNGGAGEYYFLSNKIQQEFATLTLHYYNKTSVDSSLSNNKSYKENKIPFKLVIDDAVINRTDNGKIERKNLIDIDTVQFVIPNEIKQDKLTIGFIYSNKEGNKKFYFYSTQIGKGRVSTNNIYTIATLEYIQKYMDSCLMLKDILEEAGAIFEKDENEEWDIDLDYTKITKDKFIDIFA